MIVALLTAAMLGGCGGVDSASPPAAPPATQPPSPAGTGRPSAAPGAVSRQTLAADRIGIVYDSDEKEQRGGLYALWVTGEEALKSVQQIFSGLADRPSAPLRAGPGYVLLVGRLPRMLDGDDYLDVESGTLEGSRISIRFKYVRFVGARGQAPAPKGTYFRVSLPGLPAGKYQAALNFTDYEYNKYAPDQTARRAPPERPQPFFRPLTCEFEVLMRDVGGWGQPAGGLTAGILLPEKQPVADGRIAYELMIACPQDKPLKIISPDSCGRLASSGANDWKETVTPDFYKSDAPSAEMLDKNAVTIKPPQIIRSKRSLPVKDGATITVCAAYSISADFAKAHGTWSGTALAPPVTLKIAGGQATCLYPNGEMSEQQAREWAARLANEAFAKKKLLNAASQPVVPNLRAEDWRVAEFKDGRWKLALPSGSRGPEARVSFAHDGSDPKVEVSYATD